jgi:hypothetical protein
MKTRGNSFANGLSASGPGSPYWAQRYQGFDIRPVTHWDWTQGRDPA